MADHHVPDPRKERLTLNWGDDLRNILSNVFDQGEWGICWAVALLHTLEAILRKEGKLDRDESLSIQMLLELVPKDQMADDFGILDLGAATAPIRDIGMVLESFVETSFPLDMNRRSVLLGIEDQPRFFANTASIWNLDDFVEQYGTAYEFEHMMLSDLADGPIVVGVPMYSSFHEGNGKNIYSPNTDVEDLDAEDVWDEEFGGYVAEPWLHFMMATGVGTDEYGQRFLRCQDSDEPDWGHSGAVDIALGEGLILTYVHIKDVHRV